MTSASGNVFWQAPFRPLFLCAILWALVAPAVWIWPLHGVDPVFWHLHELIFGMAGAASGGYLLTALPSWVGHEAGQVRPARLRGLVLLWMVARLSFMVRDWLPLPFLLVAISGYFLWLSWLLAGPVVVARAWRKLPLAGFPLVLAALDAGLVARWRSAGLDSGLAILAVLAFAILMGHLCGRLTAAFSRSWLDQRGDTATTIREGRWLGMLAGALVALGGAMLTLSAQDAAAGAALALAGGLQLWRTIGWRPVPALAYPALALLFAAWIWLGVGLVLLGAALVRPDVLVPAEALHGLTMGGMGSMIAAVALRPAMRREGTRLAISPPIGMGFALVWVAPVLRLGANLGWALPGDPLQLAAAAWMSGWLLLSVGFLPALRGTPPHPVLSARTLKQAVPDR